MASLMGHYRNQCVLQVPHSEDALRHLDGQICTINRTKGDGACGVHAAVGTFTAGQYCCADARTFLFQTYELISVLFSIGFGLERSACTQNLVWAAESIHYELISLLFETYEFISFFC